MQLTVVLEPVGIYCISFYICLDVKDNSSFNFITRIGLLDEPIFRVPGICDQFGIRQSCHSAELQ